jgi:hypothetical protein
MSLGTNASSHTIDNSFAVLVTDKNRTPAAHSGTGTSGSIRQIAYFIG